VALYGLTAERRKVRKPLDIRVQLRQHSLHVSALARLVDPFRGRHILPRHLGASIAHPEMDTERMSQHAFEAVRLLE
jgi:hypothetical protein